MKAVIFSYSHSDETLRGELERHLAMLKRREFIGVWHDRKIEAGDDLDDSIRIQLDKADIVLLLVSPDFLASEYCYSVELQRALIRHHNGDARVIPIILRPCDWQAAPFGRLSAVPTDAKPVTRWANRDEAWLSVVTAIRAVVLSKPPAASRNACSSARRKQLLQEAFTHMTQYFERSLADLEQRHPDIQAHFTQIDALQFTAVIFRAGRAASQCRIRLHLDSREFGAGIAFSKDISSRRNRLTEILTVGSGTRSMHLRSSIKRGRGTRDAHLSVEDASALYWARLLEQLQ